MFWAKDHGAIVCGAKEIQKKIFGAIVFGQISLGQMSLNHTRRLNIHHTVLYTMERHPPFSASQKEARQKSQKGRKRSELGLKVKVKKFAMRRRRPRGQGCEGGECFSINFASFQAGTFWIADAPEMTETIFGKAVFGMAGTD